ncbi:CpsD/CapB family tyrosine-protein kinase [Paenibacillus tarimensis]|uniref:CpsD/CapB family tyrosine-protein kinase n=1 Tax=Paenibacillus tarimensis TaxID=416012 RepID=UPI001F2B61B7|nr:CpsD/CapB family tyrosine-protein kinase [Paenibacillus tarimensis]MCF2944241.1 CpsD/CapB family tyrosine-protein kinase [Paenibacillus tarimensis]
MSRSTRNIHLITEINQNSPVSEAYKVLRTSIEFSNLDSKTQTIMITSTKTSEGKSTTSANLAIAYAQAGKRVLLIDADMRKPTQHHIFRLSNRVGLTALLSHQADLNDVILPVNVDNLYVLPAGAIAPNPSEMLTSKRMTALLEELRGMYDMIILDTPPLLAVTDAQIVATQCDGVLLVIDSGRVKRDSAVKAKACLDRVHAKILGVVLNNVKRSDRESYYHYY